MVYPKSSYCYLPVYGKKVAEVAVAESAVSDEQSQIAEEENLVSESSNIITFQSYAECAASMEQMKSQIDLLTMKLDYLLSAVNSATSVVNTNKFVPEKDVKFSLNDAPVPVLKRQVPHSVLFESKKHNSESVYIGGMNNEFHAYTHPIGTATPHNYLEGKMHAVESTAQMATAVDSVVDSPTFDAPAKNTLEEENKSSKQLNAYGDYDPTQASVYHAEGLSNNVYASPSIMF